jgi:hypothetical protein
LNNPTEEEIQAIQAKANNFVFIIGGLEIAPSPGNPRIQG